jgi:hypothetical protein
MCADLPLALPTCLAWRGPGLGCGSGGKAERIAKEGEGLRWSLPGDGQPGTLGWVNLYTLHKAAAALDPHLTVVAVREDRVPSTQPWRRPRSDGALVEHLLSAVIMSKDFSLLTSASVPTHRRLTP